MSEERLLCTLCHQELTSSNETYTIHDIFEKWKKEADITFSDEVIQEHSLYAKSVSRYYCPSCGLSIFLPPLVGNPRFYEEIQEAAKSWYYPEDRWEFSKALEEIEEGNELLEIGCGDGIFLEKASQYAVHAIGNEYNERSVEKARAKGLDVERLSLQELAERYPSGFDVICSFQVLEHIPEPVHFMKHISDNTKAGGKVIVSVPNNDGFLKYIKIPPTNIPPHHITRWTEKSLKLIGKKVGLSVIKVLKEPIKRNQFGRLLQSLSFRFFGSSSEVDTRLGRIKYSLFNLPIKIIIKSLVLLKIETLPLHCGHSILLVFQKTERDKSEKVRSW